MVGQTPPLLWKIMAGASNKEKAATAEVPFLAATRTWYADPFSTAFWEFSYLPSVYSRNTLSVDSEGEPFACCLEGLKYRWHILLLKHQINVFLYYLERKNINKWLNGQILIALAIHKSESVFTRE